MKKSLIAAAVVAAVGISAYLGFRPDPTPALTELQLANAEALTNDEGTGTRYKCYTSTHYEECSSVIICSTCEENDNATDDLFNFHD